MRKLFLIICMFLSISTSFAGKIDKIVFFGDSLTDNGNLYSYLLHILPKSPPYYEGRFSNGPTWAENVSRHFYQSSYMASSNYAVAGATAVFHMPNPKFISPTILEVEVDKYLLDTIFRNRSHTLFVIWIGANDYIFDANKDPSESTEKVIDKISWSIQTLYAHGGRHFFVLNLPDLAKAPEVIDSGASQKVHNLTVMHNEKLNAKLAKLRNKYNDIELGSLDIFSVFETAMNDPDEFNRIYNTNITNLTDACWKGGFLLSKSLSQAMIRNDLEKAVSQNKDTDVSTLDIDAMTDLVMNTPELAQAYQMGQSYLSGNVPCANPDSYLFWDHLHPTAVVHNVLSTIVIEQLRSTMHVY